MKKRRKRTLTVATCQFSVEPDIEQNCRQIIQQMRSAQKQGAEIAHFSECALSGYAGVDIPSTKSIDWELLTAATNEIRRQARSLKLWVLLGSTHRLSTGNKPHNSVYVIDSQGNIVERYDKRFCTGKNGKRPTFDLAHYSSGQRFTTFRVNKITCGILICFDYRFPELYRELKKRGVEVLFQSFHNARRTVVEDENYNIWKTIVPATMSCRAAENHFWVSANNSSTRLSRWASFVVRPDGLIVDRLKLHRPGVLMTQMDVGKTYFDAPGHWRPAAMAGQLHSGPAIEDPRSADPTCL